MTQDLADVLDDLDALAAEEGEVSLGDVIEKIGGRGQGVLLLLPGLVGVTPVGGIPGVPTILGVFTVLIAGQIIFGKRRLWLPGPLKRRAVEDKRLSRGVERLRGPARWIDRHFGARLEALTGTVSERVAAALCLVFGALLPPLEVVPFAALVPFAAIALLGLALSLKDGVLMLIAYLAAAAALWGVWMLLPFG